MTIAAQRGAGFYSEDYNIIDIAYSDIQGNWPGSNNINDDPMFVDTVNGDYRLQSGPPCIDVGTAFFEIGADTLINLNPWQYNGSAPDMGAYEFGPPLRIMETQNIPGLFTLKQNYPSTTIEVSIPKSEFVTLKIYNLLGQEVATLVSEKLAAGRYNYSWNVTSLASGVYIYKIQAGVFQQVKKMVYLK
jgi:type IX secretion system substrate protein